MGSGWAVTVTVVGVASILALLALLARYLGLWTWALAWLRAAREEKVQLCRSQRTTSTRSYLFDNDLDWIGLWPRTGSYKRFTNLDDLTSVASVDDSVRQGEEPDLPPQPLRPAPAPPPRMPGWSDSGEGSPSPASSVGLTIDTPPEPSRPAPVLDRRDSNRSLTGRISRRDSSKELLGPSQQSSPKRASTNPFRASWVPPDESSEASFAQTSFSMEAGPCPGALPPPTATWSQPVAGFAAAPIVSSKPQQQESVATINGPQPQPTPYGPQPQATPGVVPLTLENLWEPQPPARPPRGLESGSSRDEAGNVFDQKAPPAGGVGDKGSGGGGGGVKGVAMTPPAAAATAAVVTDAHVNKLYDSSVRENDLPVTLPKDIIDFSKTTDGVVHHHEAGESERSGRTNAILPAVSEHGSAVYGYEKPSAVMHDNQLQQQQQQQSTATSQASTTYRMQQLRVSTDLTSRDPQLTSELGRSYEVPATPPNTATYPVSPHSPHISSRLAEVEARMRLLGAPPEPTRDTSQDWWPAEPSPSSVAREEVGSREGRRNPFIVSVGSRDSGGLSSVDEEVFLLHDADPSLERTRTEANSGDPSAAGGVGGSRAGVVTVESEEDASARRVREYLASLSARLRQLPDEDDLPRTAPDFMETPPTSATFPATPPNSATAAAAARASSQGSMETPPSSAEPVNLGGFSRPPATSASLRNLYSNRRSSAEVSPVSPGFFSLSTNRRLSLDTPPSSAGLVTATPPNSATSQVAFGETPPSSAGYSSTPPSSAGLSGSFDAGLAGGGAGTGQTLKRAVSCDSVSSDTSVTLGELEETCGQITGHLSVQLIYDSDTADLEVVVAEARDLVGPDPHAAVDSYVRVFLLPDKSTNMQTRVCRRTNNPTYREKFLFALEEEELGQRSLAFYMYASDKFTNTLIGEAHLRLTDVDVSVPLSTVLPLTDTGQLGVGYGEIMFSLSYLPTAERLTVVVVKARSLQWTSEKTTADPFVKVYVLQNGKKVMKKKTSVKKDTRSPVFNEAMIFSVPAPALHNIQLRVTVAEHSSDGGQARSVGHVIVGTQATGKALSHWNQMMSALRKPIGMWHPIRR